MRNNIILQIPINTIYNISMLTWKKPVFISFTFYSRSSLLKNKIYNFKSPYVNVSFKRNIELAAFTISLSLAHKTSIDFKTICANKHLFYTNICTFQGLLLSNRFYINLLLSSHLFYFNPIVIKLIYNLLNFSYKCVLRRNYSRKLLTCTNVTDTLTFSDQSLVLPWYLYRNTVSNIKLRYKASTDITILSKAWIF